MDTPNSRGINIGHITQTIVTDTIVNKLPIENPTEECMQDMYEIFFKNTDISVF